MAEFAEETIQATMTDWPMTNCQEEVKEVKEFVGFLCACIPQKHRALLRRVTRQNKWASQVKLRHSWCFWWCAVGQMAAGVPRSFFVHRLVSRLCFGHCPFVSCDWHGFGGTDTTWRLQQSRVWDWLPGQLAAWRRGSSCLRVWWAVGKRYGSILECLLRCRKTWRRGWASSFPFLHGTTWRSLHDTTLYDMWKCDLHGTTWHRLHETTLNLKMRLAWYYAI